MTTNFPSSIDNFTNPTSSSSMASPSHSAQHADVNDAVEAIETALLDGAPLFIDDANERVGIGTTNPSELLDINAGTSGSVELSTTGGRTIQLTANDSEPYLSVGSTTSHSASIMTNGVRRLTVDASDNVGIGKTTPAYKLDVAGDIHISNSNPYLIFTDTDTNAESRISANSNFGSLIIDADYNNEQAGTNIIFNSDGSERMRIDSSGDVGIGTTSPVDMLDVGGSGSAGSFRVHASGGGESFRVVTTVVRSKNIVDLTTASAANVFISSTNNSMYRSTSSAKYKTDIETLDNEHADIVFELRPVWYRSTTGNDPEEYSYYGLIAEEVADVDPRLVHFGADPDCGCVEDEEGHIEHEQACLTEPESVFYERLVPHLISVVQRQQTQIDTQQAQINALTTRIEALENPPQV